MKSVCDKYGALFILDEVSSTLLVISVVKKKLTKSAYLQVMSGMGREHSVRSFPRRSKAYPVNRDGDVTCLGVIR